MPPLGVISHFLRFEKGIAKHVIEEVTKHFRVGTDVDGSGYLKRNQARNHFRPRGGAPGTRNCIPHEVVVRLVCGAHKVLFPKGVWVGGDRSVFVDDSKPAQAPNGSGGKSEATISPDRDLFM